MPFDPFTSTPTIAQLAVVAQEFLDRARLYHRAGGQKAFAAALHAEAALWMCVYNFPMVYLVGQDADCKKGVELIWEGSGLVRMPMETMPHAALWFRPNCWKGRDRRRFDGQGVALIEQGLALWERSLRSQRDDLRVRISGIKRKPRRKGGARADILEVVGEDELQGPEITLLADYGYDYTRRVLADMVKTGQLKKTDNGYKRGQ
jgi:hypothetical protein